MTLTHTHRQSCSLAWSHGVFTLETLGGMLGPSLFILPDGRQVAPFHIAPWFDEPPQAALPGILQRLRGEWPCVPFGVAADRPAGAGYGPSRADAGPDSSPHGHGSNHHWHFIDSGPDELAMEIAYPPGHPVSRLERRVRGVDGRPELAFELTIEVRRDCALPIGLHPVLRLDPRPGSMLLKVDAKAAATFPGDVDPSSIFSPGHITDDWHAITLRDGGSLDPAVLPLQAATEDLLQLIQAGGAARLANRIGQYETRLQWDATHFPDLLLWFSNHGRSHHPWNGRHLALGVEPVCSAFDLGTQISTAPNRVNAHGSPTAQPLWRGKPFVTRYTVAVVPFHCPL